ncbi:MAG: F0F1 ATP synthase subunit gamma [Gammaproteobacteria bacterium]|nr:F0F1 ATP synthase subunit gamma [Gammaproteobacteria bacterium]
MAVGQEIRTKISSIKNTQKITKAMEMVAASKMRKTQDRMQASRPYSEKMWQIIQHLSHANPEYKHEFTVQKENVETIGVIVITSDRGLCGGLNSNLFRKLLKQIRVWEDEGKQVKLGLVGRKGTAYFASIGGDSVAQVTQIGDQPGLADIIGVIKVMLDAYQDNGVQQVYLAYNDFVNTMVQDPTVKKLLPIDATEANQDLQHHWDYIYEPDAKEVLDHLLIRYAESIIYQAVLENNASEQAARMVAMKAASDNAGKLIEELQLVYNKARQAAITQEIAEIVAGAAAVQ